MKKIKPFPLSLLLHFALILIWLATKLTLDWQAQKKSVLEVEVYQTPQLQTPAATLQMENKPTPPPPPPPQESPRAVFGVSREALTNNDGEGPAIKAGNTVTKENDNLTLKSSDPTALPIPADEFLVTQMPKIRREFRAEYPVEAKKAGIEGPVVMEVLIDREGVVRQVNVLSSPGYGLDEAAVSALKKFEFSPARVKEDFVAVKIHYTYRFVLENK